jgi:hypothetical protein
VQNTFVGIAILTLSTPEEQDVRPLFNVAMIGTIQGHPGTCILGSMKRRPTVKDWLPLARAEGGAVELPTGEAFHVEWIDFDRGIRVGNLAPHERITQILKYGLEQKYGTGFVIDRWGRGVYWQSITF